MLTLLAVLAAGLVAGTMNALAGGGSFITLSILVVAGLDPRSANITSTVALFPGQVASGVAGRSLVADLPQLPFRAVAGIGLVGGAIGAVLLLVTPASFFARLVPYLVLFATAVFAWGSFLRRPPKPGARRMGPRAAAAAQLAIGVYGGYFGGGIGFLLMAALTVAGLAARPASATKNALAGVINASAVLIFLFSPSVAWTPALVLGGGAVVGGQFGAWFLRRVDERWLRIGVALVGCALTAGLFLRPA